MIDPLAGTSQSLGDIRSSIDSVNISAARVSTTLTSAFAKAAASGQSFDKTLQGVLTSLSKMSLTTALQPLQQGLSALVASAFGGGGASPHVTPFAQGGVVAQPTFFSSGGGVGLMGERGAEAIIPLARGPDGRLGVAGGAQAAPAHVTVNISVADADSFRKSQVQIASTLARAVARGQRGL